MTTMHKTTSDTTDRSAGAVRAVQRVHQLARGCPTAAEAAVVLEHATTELGRVIGWHGLSPEPFGELLADAGNRAIRRAPHDPRPARRLLGKVVADAAT